MPHLDMARCSHEGIVMTATTEHVQVTEPVSPVKFPQPGSHRWGLWWVAVVAALATATALVVTVVVANNSNDVTGDALVGYGSADAAEQWLDSNSVQRSVIQYGSADAAEHAAQPGHGAAVSPVRIRRRRRARAQPGHGTAVGHPVRIRRRRRALADVRAIPLTTLHEAARSPTADVDVRHTSSVRTESGGGRVERAHRHMPGVSVCTATSPGFVHHRVRGDGKPNDEERES